jgi:dipeptidyl aminopeptidase/acylaminoacyl peptidase
MSLPKKGVFMRVRLWSAVSAVALSWAAVPAWAADPSLVAEAQEFGARPAAYSVDISPSGKRVAMLVPGPGRTTVLKVIDLSTVAVTNVIKTEGSPASLQWCAFASDDQLICQFGGNVLSGGDTVAGFTRLMDISADGKTIKQLGQKDHADSALRQYDGTVLDWLPDQQGSVLMARVYAPELGETGNYNRDTRQGLGVDRIDLSNLKITHVEPPRPAAADYLTDGRGNVRVMETDDSDHEGLLTGVEHFLYRTTVSRDWKPLTDYDEKSHSGVVPIAVDGTINAAYVLKKVDGRDALFTVKLDGSGATVQIAANPNVDIDSVVRIGRGQRVIGYTYADDRRHTVYFDPEFASLHNALAQALGEPLVDFEGASADGSKLLIFASSDSDPGSYYVFDKTTRHMDKIAAVRPGLAGHKLASVKTVSVPAPDHAQIPAYLTLPPSGASKNLPAVVLPHGGPTARDEWGFDWLAQFLAARGYAVIQPNYRGSSGYGEEWEGKNGFRDWKTAISDITASAHYLVDQGIADPKRLAIVGWSYGGYAALQSAGIEPTLYKAAVAIAPVTDLSLLKSEAKFFTNQNLVADFVGSGSNATDGSPVHHASDIKVPVLMFHGDLDLNVAIAQSERMEDALTKAGDKVELVKFAGLDHQLNDSDARTQLLTRIGEFLDASIGH